MERGEPLPGPSGRRTLSRARAAPPRIHRLRTPLTARQVLCQRCRSKDHLAGPQRACARNARVWRASKARARGQVRLAPPRRAQPSGELQKFQVLHASAPSPASSAQHAAQQSSMVGSRFDPPACSTLLACARPRVAHTHDHPGGSSSRLARRSSPRRTALAPPAPVQGCETRPNRLGQPYSICRGQHGALHGPASRTGNMRRPASRTDEQGAAHQVKGALLGDARLPIPRAQAGRGVGRCDKLRAQGHVQVLRAAAHLHGKCIVCRTFNLFNLFTLSLI